MADLATLGIAVDTSDARGASGDLDRLSAASAKAEKAAQSMGAAFDGTGKKVSSSRGAIERQTVEMAKLDKAIVQMERDLKAVNFDRIGSGAAGFSKGLSAVNDNARLTSNQMLNLSRQGNDVITMFALGAAPMQIFASQAGQIYDAISSGPGGLTGGLKQLAGSGKAALASLAAFATTPVGIAAGLTAAAGAAVYFATTSGKGMRDLDEATKAFDATLKRLEGSYASVGEAARAAYEEGLKFSRPETLSDLKGAISDIKSDLKVLQRDTVQEIEGAFYGRTKEAIGVGAKELLNLNEQLRTGAITVGEFRTSLGKLRLRDDLSGPADRLVDRLYNSTSNARELEAQLRGVEKALKDIDGKGGRLRIPSILDDAANGGAFRLLEKFNPAAADEIRKALESQADGIRKVREETEKLTPEQQKLQEYNAAWKDRGDVIRDSVVAMQLELKTIGMTTPEAAALRYEYEKTTEAKRMAAEAGTVVSPEELGYIKEAAGRVGEFTSAIEAANEAKRRAEQIGGFEGDLLFERQQAGRSSAEQQVFARLRSLNVDAESEAGQRYATIMRETQVLNDARVESEKGFQGEVVTTRDLLQDVAGTLVSGFGQGEDALDGLIGTFAKFNQQMASAGLDKLFNGVFGKAPSISSAIGSLGSYSAPQQSGGSSYSRVLPVIREPLEDISSAGSSLADGIRTTAKAIGIGARDLATIISYETGGTFDPRQKGPTTQYGQHRGLIQFGEPQARQYGADFSSSLRALTSQLGENGAIVRYFKSAGFKPGMGILDGYSAVNAGRVGRYGASDAFNGGAPGTVYDKVTTQFAGHYANADRLLGGAANDNLSSRIVSDGVVDANRRTVRGEVPGLDLWSGMRGGDVTSPLGSAGGISGGQGTNQAVAGGLGLLSAGIGGYQSGSPIGGAFSGALSGFEIGSSLTALGSFGGPIGAVAGGIAGLIGGLFGKSKQEKEAEAAKRRQGEAIWAKTQQRAMELERVFDRAPEDNLTSTLADIDKSIDELYQSAKTDGLKGNAKELESTRDKADRYKEELISDRRQNFGVLSEQFERGLGADNNFESSFNAMRDFGKSARGFIEDAVLVFGKGAKQIAQARQSVSTGLLAVLRGDKDQTDVEKKIDQAKGAAAGLIGEFQRMGYSAERAGSVVQKSLTVRLDRIREDLDDSVQSDIRSLQDKDYLNDAADLIKENESLIISAKAAGGNLSQVALRFALSAQKMVDGAELTDDQFNELIATFPSLAGVVHGFAGDLTMSAKEIETARQSLQDRIFAATNDTSTQAGALAAFDRGAALERAQTVGYTPELILLREQALNAERSQIIKRFADGAIAEEQRLADERKRALEEAQDYLKGLTRSIKEFVDGFRAGADSPLSPKDRLAEAQKNFDAQRKLALSGDRDAASGITRYASDLIEANRAYNASAPAGQAITDRVLSQLEAIPKQVSAEQFIVDAIKESTDATKDGLSAVADANFDAGQYIAEQLALSIGRTPMDFASNLAPYFNALDSSVDGLLSFSELQSGLRGLATDAQIRTMISVLDANGDGQISKLELINAATRGTQSATSGVQSNTGTTNTRLAELAQINNQQSYNTNRSLGQLIQTVQAGNQQLLAIARNTGVSNSRGYSMGGYTGPGGVNEYAGAVHRGEVVWSQRDIASAGGVAAVEAMRMGRVRAPVLPRPVMTPNDNGGIERRLERIERAILDSGDQNARATVAGAKHVREGVDQVAEAQGEMARSKKLAA